jgi:hypothetical protein
VPQGLELPALRARAFTLPGAKERLAAALAAPDPAGAVVRLLLEVEPPRPADERQRQVPSLSLSLCSVASSLPRCRLPASRRIHREASGGERFPLRRAVRPEGRLSRRAWARARQADEVRVGAAWRNYHACVALAKRQASARKCGSPCACASLSVGVTAAASSPGTASDLLGLRGGGGG